MINIAYCLIGILLVDKYGNLARRVIYKAGTLGNFRASIVSGFKQAQATKRHYGATAI